MPKEYFSIKSEFSYFLFSRALKETIYKKDTFILLLQISLRYCVEQIFLMVDAKEFMQ